MLLFWVGGVWGGGTWSSDCALRILFVFSPLSFCKSSSFSCTSAWQVRIAPTVGPGECLCANDVAATCVAEAHLQLEERVEVAPQLIQRAVDPLRRHQGLARLCVVRAG